MRKSALCFLFIVCILCSPAHSAQADIQRIRSEAAGLEPAVHDVATATSARVLQTPKAVYLEDYGIVVALEIALDPRTPFSAPQSAAETRRIVETRRTQVRDGLVELLRQRLPQLQALAGDERVTIVVHLLNTNPVDFPDFPTQLVIGARKQDVVEFNTRGGGNPPASVVAVSVR